MLYLVHDFYCEEHREPKSWDDIAEFIQYQKAKAKIKEYYLKQEGTDG